MAEVFPVDVVVSFDEDLSQDGFSDGIVFGVELVEAVEGVPVLRRKRQALGHTATLWRGECCRDVLPRACRACPR